MSRSKATLWMMLTTLLTVITLLMLPHTPAVPVRTILVERGEWMRTEQLGAAVNRVKSPCISLQDGVISAVCVSAGDTVRKGDLLFVMDTSMEEEMLSALKQTRYQSRSLPEEAEAFAAAQELEWLEAEMRLKTAIEAAQIRAPRDGIVDQVFVRAGDPVKEAAMLGCLSGEERQIIAAGFAEATSTLKTGMPAILHNAGENIGTAVLEAVSAPDENGMQQMTLRPLDQELLQDWRAGQGITVEWMIESIPDCALIPIGAVDDKGRVWVVENGRACAYAVDVSRRNQESIAADLSWAGRRIVLEPEGLSEGCRVKEAKNP